MEIGIEISPALWCHHCEELGRSGIFLSNRSEELLVHLRDDIKLRECLVQSYRIAIRIDDHFLTGEAQNFKQLAHKCRIIGWENAERITDFIHNSRISKINLKMARVLGRTVAGQLAIDGELGMKGILAGVESGRISGHW